MHMRRRFEMTRRQFRKYEHRARNFCENPCPRRQDRRRVRHSEHQLVLAGWHEVYDLTPQECEEMAIERKLNEQILEDIALIMMEDLYRHFHTCTGCGKRVACMDDQCSERAMPCDDCYLRQRAVDDWYDDARFA